MGLAKDAGNSLIDLPGLFARMWDGGELSC